MLPTGRRAALPSSGQEAPKSGRGEIAAGCSTTTAALTLVTTRTPPRHRGTTPGRPEGWLRRPLPVEQPRPRGPPSSQDDGVLPRNGVHAFCVVGSTAVGAAVVRPVTGSGGTGVVNAAP